MAEQAILLSDELLAVVKAASTSIDNNDNVNLIVEPRVITEPGVTLGGVSLSVANAEKLFDAISLALVESERIWEQHQPVPVPVAKLRLRALQLAEAARNAQAAYDDAVTQAANPPEAPELN